MTKPLLILLALSLPACATLTPADQAGVALCKLWQATNPPPSEATTVGQVSCDVIEVTAPWVQAATLAAAKPNGQAAVDALASHPPLSSAAALVMPCIAAPEPQSKLDRELYPMRIVEPPRPGE